jgi:hypothetical protein
MALSSFCDIARRALAVVCPEFAAMQHLTIRHRATPRSAIPADQIRTIRTTTMLYVFNARDGLRIMWNSTGPRSDAPRRSGLMTAIRTICLG